MKKITSICFTATMLLISVFCGTSVYAQALYQTVTEDTLETHSQIRNHGQLTTYAQSASPTDAPLDIEMDSSTEANARANGGTTKKPTRQTTTCIMAKGMKETYYLNMDGRVRWSISNKKIAKLTKKSNKNCTIKALADGKTTITAKTATQTLKIQVSVNSGNSFVDLWCKDWVKKYIPKGMSKYDKILTASHYININYTYGQTPSARDVIIKKEGTCVSGGYLLAELLNTMGFKAKLRFAAKDDMSRYPQGVFFASQHYNVQVKINKKIYYVDGTPATGFVYLSSSKKPLYYALALGGRLIPALDKIH